MQPISPHRPAKAAHGFLSCASLVFCFDRIEDGMSRQLLHPTLALRSAPTRSFIFDLPAKPAARQRAAEPDPAASDVYLKMLSSPLRRCILTQKVLPKDLMVQLKLARLPSQPAELPRLILTPSSLLHPRFAAPMAGKGAYVMCSKDALDAVARKGSYKRISSSASLPPITARKIQSQLARRIVQEAIMFAERVRSRPVLLEGGKRRECPIWALGSLTELSVDGVGQEKEAAMSLVAVVDLTEPAADTEGSPLSTLLPSSSSAPSVPVYHLAHFFKSALLPPTPSPPNFGDPPFPSADLITSLRYPLDDLIALFVKRAARESPAPTSADDSDQHTALPSIYAIYSPTTPLEPTVAEDVVPLLVALWRFRLWSGEGWADEGDKEQ